MRSKFSFARMMATGLMAAGFIAGLSTETFAANRTWTSSNITASSYRAKWGTAFASNWAGNIVPTTADVATFGTNAFNQYAIQVQPGTEVGGLRFNNTGTNSYVISTNGLSIAGQGIVNNSGRQQTLGQITTLLANQTWSGSGAGSSIVTNNVELNGKTLSTSTDVVINTLTNTPATPTTVTVNGGSLGVWGGGPTSTVNFSVTSGFLTTADNDQGANYDSSQSDLTITGGGYNNSLVNGTAGSTNWNDVTMSGGAIDLMGTGGNLVTNSYTQSGGTVTQYVGWDGAQGLFNSTVQSTNQSGDPVGPITLGGAAAIDFSAAGSHVFNIGDKWNLFQGVNTGAGAAATNFSAFSLTNVDGSSPYAGLSFTQFGTEWKAGPGTDGTFLVFQAQTGNLVVVPEPSTIVFAGLGVAMSGWTMWKKRRLSKLLAAKAG